MTGPIPLIMPEPRYFSIPFAVAGRREREETTLNCSPYLGWLSQ